MLVDDGGAPLADIEVSAAIDADGNAFLFGWDPAEEMMPLPFFTTLPDADAMLEVHGRDVVEVEGSFDPTMNPFEPALLTGLTVQIAIRWTLINLAVGVAISAVLDVVNNVCQALGGEAWACDLATEILGYAAAVAVPGIRLRALGTFTWRALGRIALSELADTLISNACSRIPKLLIAWTRDGLADVELEAARGEYREVVAMQSYMVWRMENDPPSDPTALATMRAHVQRTALLLAELNRMVRPDYVEAYEVPSAPGALEGVLGNAALKTVVGLGKMLYSERSDLWTGDWTSPRFTVELNDRMRRLLRAESNIASWELEITDPTPVGSSGLATHLLGCGVSLVKSVGIELVSGGPTEMMAVTDIIRGFTEMARQILEAEWAANYGTGPLPAPSCTVDFFEPNATWNAVASRPVSTVGAEILDEVSLCAPDGTGGEIDWYAFTMPFISLNATADLMGVTGGVGQDARVCFELYYWDEALELIGDPPTLIRGPACGTPAAGINIPRFAVSRTTGVTWSTIFVKVYPEAGETAPDGVDYQIAINL